MLVDTSGLVAALDADEQRHDACRRAIEDDSGPLLLSPFVLAEIDYILATHIGQQVAVDFLDDVASGAFRLEPFDSSDVAQAQDVMRRYPELEIGLADASIVVLADRHGITDVLTLDERHFRVLTTRSGVAFRVLPTDSDRS